MDRSGSEPPPRRTLSGRHPAGDRDGPGLPERQRLVVDRLGRRLRADGIRTPVIMLSAQDDETVIEQARQAGISAYLSKPVDARKLSQTIHRTLALAARTSKRSLGGGVKARGFRSHGDHRRGVA